MKKEKKELEEVIKKFMDLLYEVMEKEEEEKIILDKFWNKFPQKFRESIQHFVETFHKTLATMKTSMKFAHSFIQILENDIEIRDENLNELIDEIKMMKEEIEMMREMQILLNNEKLDKLSSHSLEMKQFIELMNNFIKQSITFQRFFTNEIEKLMDNILIDVEINFKHSENYILSLKSKITKRSFIAMLSELNIEKDTDLKPSSQIQLNKGAYLDKSKLKFKINKETKKQK